MKRKILLASALLLMLACLAFSAVFPSGVATDADLIVAYNAATSTLSGGINNIVTTFSVASGAAFGNNVVLTIDSERIFCTTLSSNTFSGCTRGYNGSTAVSHSFGAAVSGFLTAAHHNALKDEIKAIEAAFSKFSCTLTQVTCTLYDNTATTGSSTLVIRAGAGQSLNALANYEANDGSIMSQVGQDGAFSQYLTSVRKTVGFQNYFGLSNDSSVFWRSATSWDSGSVDTGFSRNAAGVLEVNNGTPGTIRDLKLRTIKRTVLTVATLPGTPADGDEVWISDSADGSCVAGSGAIRVKCIYNGTSWIAH